MAARQNPRSGSGLLFAQRAHLALRRGIDCLAEGIRPTLGPAPRYVAVASSFPNRPPEILDDAALILRRVVQLPDPYENMGAMLLRHTLWQVHTAVGDGAATTAVLLQAIVHRAGRYLAAGGNPMGIRRGLEQALAAAVAALRGLAKPLDGSAEIVPVAQALCHDPEMAALLGEIFDTVGPDGYVQVEDGRSRGLEREYVEGLHWNEGFFSPHLISDPHRRECRLDNAAILISDLSLTDSEQLAPLLAAVRQGGAGSAPSLMVIANQVSGSALGLLVANHRAGKLRLLAVKCPPTSYGSHQAGLLRDLAVLTGGRAVFQAAGERAQDLSPADLGHARQAWATASTSGVLGGWGDPTLLRQHIARLRAELAANSESSDRARLRERLGKLMGGTAILRVGAATEPELMARKARAERAVLTLGRALASGVAPGGGAAYLACQQALRVPRSPSSDEAAGLKALGRALEEPLRVIARNAGFEPARVVAQVRAGPAGHGLDARSGKVVDMWAAGILDPLQVLQAALEAAVSGAVMALTTDVLVHRRDPRMTFEP